MSASIKARCDYCFRNTLVAVYDVSGRGDWEMSRALLCVWCVALDEEREGRPLVAAA